MASMSKPVAKPARRWRADPITRVSVFAPFAITFYFDFLYHPFSSPVFSGPRPEILGIPAAVWLQISFLSWAAVGAWVVWTTHSFLKSALALLLFTLPSLAGLVFGPALILILQNLGS
jgi:hypothetical protein